MKVLFDQNMPHNLKHALGHHEVIVAPQFGWEEQSLSYQQNLTGRRIAIVELTKNNWPSVKPQVDRIVEAVDACTPGAFFTIECPYVFSPRKRARP